MATFTVGAAEHGLVSASNFAEFVAIVKGRSIVSAADWGKERVELGLSGNAMLRVFLGSEGLEVNLFSTANRDEVPSVVFALGDLPQRVRLSLIQRKLNGLRTLYAIYYLHQHDRTKELVSFLAQQPEGDIEEALLGDDETLQVESISYGSWMVALWTKARDGYRALGSAAGLVFERGREAYLQKQEAEARLAHARADREETAVDAARFDLQKRRMDYLLEVTERVGDPQMKELIRRRATKAIADMTAGDREEAPERRRLGDVP